MITYIFIKDLFNNFSRRVGSKALALPKYFSSHIIIHYLWGFRKSLNNLPANLDFAHWWHGGLSLEMLRFDHHKLHFITHFGTRTAPVGTNSLSLTFSHFLSLFKIVFARVKYVYTFSPDLFFFLHALISSTVMVRMETNPKPIMMLRK